MTALATTDCAPVGTHAPACSISVAIMAFDALFGVTVADHVRFSAELCLVPSADRAEADIILVLAGVVTDRLLDELAAVWATAANPDQRIVLVSAPLRESHLVRAFGVGVVSILTRGEATPARIADAIVASGNGRTVLPEPVARWLVDEARTAQQDMFTLRHRETGGLTAREVAVLKLVAEGEDNARIAERLNYSERTIKKVIQDVMTRMNLRNRTQAVAYAIRVGAL
jgi:DNA-binding NarL/FixJ family response regulator